jgi:5-formyltetrahydrofolate cyclo-ligase
VTADIMDAKAAARAEAMARRDAIPADVREAAARAVAGGDVPFKVAAGIVVSAYHPVGSEFDVLPLLTRLAALGARTALPVVVAPREPLRFRAWSPGDPLEPGVRAIPVPVSGAPDCSPDILLVPLLAFDHRGFRLGYGAGFYDRTLAVLRGRGAVVAVGVGFAGQEIPCVPHELHDERLDWMMTEAGAFRSGRETGK